MMRLAVLAAALLIPQIALAADWSIDQLMQALARAKPARAIFHEKKFIAMLDQPLVSSGELLYSPPDRLEKRTLKPKPESLLVDGEQLVIERGKKKYTLQLHDYPDAAGFIDSVRGTLAGDRKTLERSYRLQLEGGVERWTLDLFPSDQKMAATIRQIRISGARDKVASVEVFQTDGDRSLMTVEPAVSSVRE